MTEANYTVKREGDSTLHGGFNVDDFADPFEAFLEARHAALKVSKTSLGHKVGVFYNEGKSHARVGFALSGEWKWRG